MEICEKAKEFADKKLQNVSKNQNLTDREKEIYREIFFVDYIQNTFYERVMINDLLHIRK